MPPAFTARKWWFNFSPQNGLSFDWSDGTKSSFTFWKDDEASFLGDCVFADTSGRWSSTACESYLQGAICQVPTGRFYSTQERCAVNLYDARHCAKQELWGKVERIICLQEGFGLLGDTQTNNRYRRQGYQMIQEPQRAAVGVSKKVDTIRSTWKKVKRFLEGHDYGDWSWWMGGIRKLWDMERHSEQKGLGMQGRKKGLDMYKESWCWDLPAWQGYGERSRKSS